MKSNVEIYWKIYGSTNDWIRFSDTKAATILGINSLSIGFILSNLPFIKQSVLDSSLFSIFFLLAILATILSVSCSIISLYPSLKTTEPDSIILFGDIAKKFDSGEQYHRTAQKIFSNDIDTVKQIASQVWVNSTLAQKKYTAVRWSFVFLMMFVLFIILALLLNNNKVV